MTSAVFSSVQLPDSPFAGSRVVVTTGEGSQVEGSAESVTCYIDSQPTFPLESGLHPSFQVIKTLEFSKDSASGSWSVTVTAIDGRVVLGRTTCMSLQGRTPFGEFALPVTNIRRVEFLR